MKCHCYWLLGFCLLPLATVWSQHVPAPTYGPNLVPNPGFEKMRTEVPFYDMSGAETFRKSIDSWVSPTKTTPDLHLLINDEESEKPRTGQAMAAILTHNPESTRSDTWREYLQVKLDKPLEEGEEYYLEFYVRQHKKSVLSSNNIGASVSQVPINNSDYYPLTGQEPVLNVEEVLSGPDAGWVKVSGTFFAWGYERFLIIGNFFNNRDTRFKHRRLEGEDLFQNAYYLIDDVTLQHLIPPNLAEMELSVGQVIRLDRIYFDFDKWDLLPRSFTQLDQLVDLMNKYPSLRIAIHGHTDSRGSDPYNIRLSDRRAQSVHDYLQANGIAEERLASQGFGESRPIDTNATDEGRQMNRRVEFVVVELEADVEIQNVATDGY
ncbi:MAG: OmpA family protein [Bacteroidota bacterium]